MFSACHYRLRYAYDYSIQFDIDEFWTASNTTKEKLLTDFLDVHMLEEYATVGFYQVRTSALLTPLSSECFTKLKCQPEGQILPSSQDCLGPTIFPEILLQHLLAAQCWA